MWSNAKYEKTPPRTLSHGPSLFLEGKNIKISKRAEYVRGDDVAGFSYSASATLVFYSRESGYRSQIGAPVFRLWSRGSNVSTQPDHFMRLLAGGGLRSDEAPCLISIAAGTGLMQFVVRAW